MLVTAYIPISKDAGKKLLAAIFGFGICIIVFGISSVFWISVAALFQEVKTEKIVLSGGSFTNHQEVLSYIKTIQERITKLGFEEKNAAYFVYNYGKQTDVILTKFDELTDVDIEQRMIKAEVWFSVLYESACSP